MDAPESRQQNARIKPGGFVRDGRGRQ